MILPKEKYETLWKGPEVVVSVYRWQRVQLDRTKYLCDVRSRDQDGGERGRIARKHKTIAWINYL